MANTEYSTQQDYYWMSLALAQAKRGIYSTTPNPAVGCVIVQKGELVSASFHQRAGSAHAEARALSALDSNSISGVDIYITLEPCFRSNQNPPCVDRILRIQPARVVIASLDPNPRTHGKSIALLRQHEIKVIKGVLDAENRSLNKGFFSRHQRCRPWIVSKLAASIDGKIALNNGESKWITGHSARNDAHLLRALSCCILTSVETVITDDPQLTVRYDVAALVSSRAPKIAIIDNQLRIPLNASVLRSAPYIFYAAPYEQAVSKKKRQLHNLGARCVAIDVSDTDTLHLSLLKLSRYLAKMEINRVLIEAGPRLNSAFLTAGLLDEIIFYTAPNIIGVGKESFVHQISQLNERIICKRQAVRLCEDDMRVDYLLEPRSI